MKIWGRENSTNVRKVLWCAEEVGLDYEHIPAGGAFGIVGSPEYRALNPNGLVPCLEDDGLVLWESNAIVRYLARRYGEPPFAPADPRQWAAADKWMDWTSLSFAVPFRDLFWNLVRCSAEDRDSAAMERGGEQCAQLMGMADAALEEHPWFSGEDFGIGDIPLGCIAYAWFSMPIDRPGLSRLEGWYVRLSDRPAYQKAVMTPLT
ncbi:glutathione S-transferase family protein [Rhodobium gokarnense]|uniref:Glutathione S-transferase n=1 Tax=Rhodobium gokarnense TaxID=364296 RepID=A0ABT3HFR2_9HYPH|nr:glutathione S-transferase [Rhodobium gokarnense]MCW2309235.1 glutathione S-transferase [Rhodobium gokarnense]